MSRNAGVDNHLAISLSRTTSYENYPRALRSSRRISSASRRIRPANRRIAAVAGGPPSAASGPLLCHRPACRHATPPLPPPSRPRLSWAPLPPAAMAATVIMMTKTTASMRMTSRSGWRVVVVVSTSCRYSSSSSCELFSTRILTTATLTSCQGGGSSILANQLIQQHLSSCFWPDLVCLLLAFYMKLFLKSCSLWERLEKCVSTISWHHPFNRFFLSAVLDS